MKNKFLLALCGSLLSLFCLDKEALGQPSELFISEYIEGSSNNKAIELYNGTGTTIDLSTGQYVVQMYFNGNTTAGLTINLTGTVSPGGVFVLAHSSANAAILAKANQTSGASFYNGDDAIVLRKGGANGTIIDAIGQTGLDPGTEWGSGLTSTADNTLRRKISVCAGDTNAADTFDPSVQWEGFATDTFDGLGTHAGCENTTQPGVAITQTNESTSVGEGGATDTYTISLNTAPSGAVTIEVSAGEQIEVSTDGQNFSSSLTLAFTNTIPQTVLVRAVDDATSEVSPHTGTITHQIVATEDEANYPTTLGIQPVPVSITDNDEAIITKIHQIQGSGEASPVSGQTLTIEGIVVGDYQGSGQLGGFFVQEEDVHTDNDTLTSEGIFVFSTKAVALGDKVQLTGKVEEKFGQTQITFPATVTILSAANTLPSPRLVDLPVSGSLERFEGMYVVFAEELTVTENYNLARFGELVLSAEGRLINPTNVIDPNDSSPEGTTYTGNSNIEAVKSQQASNNSRSIILDDARNGSNNMPVPYINTDPAKGPVGTIRLGSTVSNLTGILSYGFDKYRIYPLPSYQEIQFNYAPRPEAPLLGMANLKVAGMNVLNYFNGDGNGGGFPTPRGADTQVEFERQQAKIFAALRELNADVLGLMEVENDGTGTNSAIQDLVNGLNESIDPATPTYSFISDPATGVGTDAIKVAIIYKPAVVTPVGVSLSSTDAIFDRLPVAQTFKLNQSGEVFTLVVNHFKSKGSCPKSGDTDQGQGCWNLKRVGQAEALLTFIDELKSLSGDADVLAIGDFNAYEQEDPMDRFRAAGLVSLVENSYSYVFNGQAGSLDHALATPCLAAQFTGGAKWHINADEPRFIDYNTEYETGLYTPSPFRSSDHDPVLVGFNLYTPELVFTTDSIALLETASPYTVNLTLSAPAPVDQTISIKVNNGDGVVYGEAGDYVIEGTTSENNTVLLTIPAGNTMASFIVKPNHDEVKEKENEVVTFNLEAAGECVKIGTANSFTFTILDVKKNEKPRDKHTFFAVWPNPTNGIIEIAADWTLAEDAEVEVALQSYFGDVTLKCKGSLKEVSRQLSEKLSQSRMGVYFIRIKSGNEEAQLRLLKL